MFLHRVPARATKLFGPTVTEPAFFAQNFGPVLHVITRQVQIVVNFVREVFRQISRHPGADVYAKL